jgi:hypothetical protein
MKNSSRREFLIEKRFDFAAFLTLHLENRQQKAPLNSIDSLFSQRTALEIVLQ